MNLTQSALLKGAIKSAISSATGEILSLPLIDAEHFNVTTFGGWKHLLSIIGITVLVSEARFFKQWADSGDTPPILQQTLADAASATKHAGEAIADAQSQAPKP